MIDLGFEELTYTYPLYWRVPRNPGSFSMPSPASVWEIALLTGLGLRHEWKDGGSVFTSPYPVHLIYEGPANPNDPENDDLRNSRDPHVPLRVVRPGLYVTLLVTWEKWPDFEDPAEVYLAFRTSSHRKGDLLELMGVSYGTAALTLSRGRGLQPTPTNPPNFERWLWFHGLELPRSPKMELAKSRLVPSGKGEIYTSHLGLGLERAILSGLGFVKKDERWPEFPEHGQRFILNGPVEEIFKGHISRDTYKRTRVGPHDPYIRVFRFRGPQPHDTVVAFDGSEWGDSLFRILGISQGESWDSIVRPQEFATEQAFLVQRWLKQNRAVIPNG